MKASWEPIAGIVRVGKDHEFGGVFEASVLVAGDEGVATVKALASPITTAQRRAAFQALREAGFHTVRWTRHAPDGTVTEVTADLTRGTAGDRQ